MNIKELCKAVNDRNWIAFYYPRLKKVAINGGPAVDEKIARVRMLEMLKIK